MSRRASALLLCLALAASAGAATRGRDAEEGARHLRHEEPYYKVTGVTRHSKVAGNGYKPGSPLYAEQQKKHLGEGLKSASEPEQVVPDAGLAIIDDQHHGLSATLQCVVWLTLQYFIIYAAILIYRGFRSFADDKDKKLWDSGVAGRTLESAQTTVNYAPMLCVLFLSARMRALQLTQGQRGRGLPQWWVQVAMEVCCFAVAVQLVLVLIVACCFSKAPTTDNDGNIDPPRSAGMATVCVVVVRYVLMALLYGGFLTVCFGICVMEAPKDIYPDGRPPVSPAAQCVIILTLHYFIVYLALAIVRTYNQMNDYANTKLANNLQLAAYTVNLAPMLCILFISARLRALQMDPVHGNPQTWAQVAFYICTFSVIIQTLLVIILSFVGVDAQKGGAEGDIIFRAESRGLSMVFVAVRILLIILLYGGYTACIISTFILEHPKGGEYTPMVSAAMQCVMYLSVVFFVVFLALAILGLVGICRGGHQGAKARYPMVFGTLEAMRHTVALVPMLCVLFIALRMRAIFLAGHENGAPQGWAQDCMYVATVAVILQILGCLLVPCVTGRSPTRDALVRSTGSGAMMFVRIFRLVMFLIMFCAIIGVLVALVVMTPEATAGGGVVVSGIR